MMQYNYATYMYLLNLFIKTSNNILLLQYLLNIYKSFI
jgi:hypothetical protein